MAEPVITTGGGTNTSGGTDETTNPDITQTGGGGGDGSGGGEPVEGGGTTTTTPGSPPSTYSYDIISTSTALGSGFICSDNSNLECNNSISIFSRVNAFLATNTSSSRFTGCACHGGNYGFVAVNTSSQEISHCVSALHTSNYLTVNNSTQNVFFSAGVFPVLYNVQARNNSTFSPIEFESMTRTLYFTDENSVPTHFGSFNGSRVSNFSDALSSKTSAGLSGDLITKQNLTFLWSEISKTISQPINTNNIGASSMASYRYVPRAHCIEYSNVVGGTDVLQNTVLSPTGLLALVAYRDNYTSVKPPQYMFQPEDNTGKRGAGGLTGNYSISALISQ